MTLVLFAERSRGIQMDHRFELMSVANVNGS
jgi:hypothetical protein